MSYTIHSKMRLLKLVQRAHSLSSNRTSLSRRKIRELQTSSAENKLTSKTVCSRSLSSSSTGSSTACIYPDTHKQSVENPEEFWANAAENITWFKKWDKVLDNRDEPFTKWFPGGELNTAYNAIDRHVEDGYGDSIAIIHDSPVTNSVTKWTYKQLQDEVSKMADVLVSLGVQYGDRILIYMPMIPQAIAAMLATARIGAIHALVFGGFASKELSVRINHAKPRVILSASVGLEPGRTINYKELLDNAIEMSDFKPQSCVIYNRDQYPPAGLVTGRDYDWEDLKSKAKGHDCVPVKAMDPIYLLYTSGTTGTPKAVVRPSGGHAVALFWTMKNLYGIDPGEAWWAASDLGWIVGHSYICFAPLLHRNTTVLFEGKPVGTPDASTFFRVIHDHDVAGMFTAPTALRAIIKGDPDGVYCNKYDMKKLRTIFLAGELCDKKTMDWCKGAFKVPVLDHWWQTESGWPITASHVGLGDASNPRHGVTGKPCPGWNVKVVDKECKQAEPGALGRIVVKLPLPPGSLSTLWENDEKFANLYFSEYPGYYDSMDAGVCYADDYIAVQSRADDVINVAGHRIAASSIEEAILQQGDVVECAAIPLKDELKGHVPVGLCVLRPNVNKSEEQLEKEIINAVRENVGPVAAFKRAIIVTKLPKTRSGKISRQTVAAMANKEPFKIPPTIEDPSAYDEIKEALIQHGFL